MLRVTPLCLVLAAGFAALELGSGLIEPYGLLHDEYYYWACSRRLGLGYVDHPPLAAWILRGSTALLGDGLLGFGLVPALCGAGTLLLTAGMARRLGADRFGQLLAGTCVLVAPFYMAHFSFYSVNALEILLWTTACTLLLELCHTGNPRLWLALGAVAGLALANKHTFVLLALGMGLGVLAPPLRSQLRGRWPWLGCGVALLLALPNLLWNAAHDWPSLTFYRSVGAVKNIPTSPGDALLFQLFGMNPAAALVWVPGLLFLLFSRAARPYRPLGLAFAALFVVMLLSGQRRGDRIAGVYPVVLAAGAACWDRWTRRPWPRRLRWALPALLVGMGALVAVPALPLLPPRTVAAYFEALGESPEFEAQDSGHRIPLNLLGRLEWDRFADDVLAAWRTLPGAERERAVVLAPHWLLASAIEFHGRERGLGPVVSPHNAYWFWRREAAGRDVVLSVGIAPEVLDRHFAETRPLGTFRCRYCANWRPDIGIHVSYRPRAPVEALLEEWRHFGSRASPQLVAAAPGEGPGDP